jgi:hypothetical protein
MARIYANLIIKKLRTIEQVPKMFKESTLDILKQDGYDGYGDSLV